MKPLCAELERIIKSPETAREILDSPSAMATIRRHFTELLELDEGFLETIRNALTKEEFDLYRLQMCDGLSCIEIAAQLHVSSDEIFSRLANIRERVTVMLETELKRPLVP